MFDGTEIGAGTGDVRENRAREFQQVDEVIRPVTRAGIVELKGAGHGFFHGGVAAEEIIEGIGHAEEEARFLQALGGFGGELVKRIDGHELDAGFREDIFPFGERENAFHSPRGAGIAVVKGRRDEGALGIEEDVIEAPGVGADAGDGQLARGGEAQAGFQLIEQLRDVPVEGFAVALDGVGEAVDFFESDTPVVRRPRVVQGAEHEATAFGAEIAGQVMMWRHVSCRLKENEGSAKFKAQN